jgi:hypothetical protein
MRGKRNVYRLLVRKPEGKRPLGSPRHGWVDNIKADITEIEWGCVECIGLVDYRNNWKALVNAVMNFCVL